MSGVAMVANRLVDRLLVDTAFDLSMRLTRRRYWPKLEAAAAEPAATQSAVLQRIVSDNQATTFGQQHRFSTISRAEDFRAEVPIQDYEALRPFIEDQERNGTAALTMDPPVLYAQTSGTSGAPKYIPITRAGIDRVAQTQRLFATALHGGSDMFAGKLVGIGSPAVEGNLPGGSPFGSASGMVYEGMPSLVRRKYILEPEVLAIADHEVRYLVIAALCLAEPDVTGVATANPSTLLRLRSVMLQGWDEAVRAVETGDLTSLAAPAQLSAEQVTVIGRRLAGDPDRAAELRALRRACGDDIGYHHFWPRLAAITTWTGGSCGFALSALRPHLEPSTKIVELGYSASELRGSIGLDPDSNRCVPLLEDNWFEFVERELKESLPGQPEPEHFLALHELEHHRQYYLYVTTFDGLYRYDMNDIIEVTGRFHATPTIAFVQKGRGVTNITGEKLSESQVLEAVSKAQADLGIALSFFVVLAHEAQSHYRLYAEDPKSSGLVDQLADGVDKRLQTANIEYGSKRASGRLGPMVGLDLIIGTGEDFRRERVAAGQRDAQFKYLHLQLLDECRYPFDHHVAPAPDIGDGAVDDGD